MVARFKNLEEVIMSFLSARITVPHEVNLEELATLLGANTTSMGTNVKYYPATGLLKKTPASVKASHKLYGELEIHQFALGSKTELQTNYFHSKAYTKAEYEAENARGLFANSKREKFKELAGKEDMYCDQLEEALTQTFKDMGLE